MVASLFKVNHQRKVHLIYTIWKHNQDFFLKFRDMSHQDKFILDMEGLYNPITI